MLGLRPIKASTSVAQSNVFIEGAVCALNLSHAPTFTLGSLRPPSEMGCHQPLAILFSLICSRVMVSGSHQFAGMVLVVSFWFPVVVSVGATGAHSALASSVSQVWSFLATFFQIWSMVAQCLQTEMKLKLLAAKTKELWVLGVIVTLGA